MNVVQIELPPLRERREDIGLSASYFLDRSRDGRPAPISRSRPRPRRLLERFDYPGNVRELENAIEHAVAVAESPVIQPEDLPVAISTMRMLPRGRDAEAAPAGVAAASSGGRDTWSLAQVESEHIALVLHRHRGNATAAAKQLGISRTTLWRKLREYGITRSAS